MRWVSLFAAVALAAGESGKVELAAEGFRFPEGPSVDAQGNVYLVNIQDGVINRVTPDGKVSVFVDTGAGGNQSTIFDAQGNLWVCHNEPGRTGILKIDPKGQTTTVTTTTVDGRPIPRTNDMVWGADGRLYFTAPSTDPIHPEGVVFYIDTDGKTRSFASGFAFANGIALSPDKQYLYVGEERSAKNHGTLWRFKLKADGSADPAGKEVFYDFSGRRYGFDGMKFDADGNLWVAMFSESELWRLSPEGKKIDSIKIPGRNPTNIVFAGPGQKFAYVTVNDKPGKLFRVHMPATGAF